MFRKLAWKINDKHGQRVLVDLDIDSKESWQRRRAMGIVFELMGKKHNDVCCDLSQRKEMLAMLCYTFVYTLIRILDRF